MNRIIKFRAWDKKEKKMYECTIGWWTDYFNKNYWENKEYDFMQFTGLTDKNGKEIYEGDILSRVCYDDKTGALDGHDYKVVNWSTGKSRNGFNLTTNNPQINKELWEVIGNIYENPELLK